MGKTMTKEKKTASGDKPVEKPASSKPKFAVKKVSKAD